MKSVLMPGNQKSFKILQLFNIWRYQNLVLLFYSSWMASVENESDGVCLVCLKIQL